MTTPTTTPSPTPPQDPALQALPAYAQEAITALRGLLSCGHPETVRRAAVNLLAIANIPTASPKPPTYPAANKTPPTPADPPPAKIKFDIVAALDAVNASSCPLDILQYGQVQKHRVDQHCDEMLIELIRATLNRFQEIVFDRSLAQALPPLQEPAWRPERAAPTEPPRANPDGDGGAPDSNQVAAPAPKQPTPTGAPSPSAVAVSAATKDSRRDTGHSSATNPHPPTYSSSPAPTAASPKPPRPHGPVSSAITGRDLAPG